MCTFQPVFKSPLQQPAPSLTLTTRSVTDEGLGTMRRGLKWLVICMWFMLENIWRHKWHFIWPFSSLLVLNHECEVLLPSSAPHFTLKPEVRGGEKKKKRTWITTNRGGRLPTTDLRVHKTLLITTQSPGQQLMGRRFCSADSVFWVWEPGSQGAEQLSTLQGTY